MRRNSCRQRMAYEGSAAANVEDDDGSHSRSSHSHDASFSSSSSSPPFGLLSALTTAARAKTKKKRKRAGSLLVRIRSRREEPARSSPSSIPSAASTPPPPHAIPAFAWEYDAGDACNTGSAETPVAVVSPSLGGLPEEVRLHLLSYLDVEALRCVIRVDRFSRAELLGPQAGNQLWMVCCRRQWACLSAGGLSPSSPEQPVDALGLAPALAPRRGVSDSREPPNYPLFIGLSATHQPVKFDSSLFNCRWSRSRQRFRPRPATVPCELRTVSVGGQGDWTTEAAVQFTGRVGRGDRCIRADHPLPQPAKLTTKQRRRAAVLENSPESGTGSLLNRLRKSRKHPAPNKKQLERTPHWRAFCSPYMATAFTNQDDTTSSSSSSSSSSSTSAQHKLVLLHLTPRLVSYFEISILKTPEEQLPDHAHEPRDVRDCVAIGIARHGFSLHSRMPGWDDRSYGYHSDDGGIYHGEGSMLHKYGPEFGPGDTVGCGIDYAVGTVFYTLNGANLGTAFDLSQEELSQEWYPVVGLDTNCLVAGNFGLNRRSFVFDLNGKILQQREAVQRSILWHRATSEGNE